MTQSRGLPPVRCASAGAERPECGLCVGPAVRAIPQAKRKEKAGFAEPSGTADGEASPPPGRGGSRGVGRQRAERAAGQPG
jgi:hypothetical protein